MFTSALGSSKSLLGSMPLGVTPDPFELSAISEIVLTSEADSVDLFASAESTLSLTDSAVGSIEATYVVLSTLTLTQDAVLTGVLLSDAESTLTFTQAATANIGRVYTASNDLTLTDEASGRGDRVYAENVLTLTDSAHKAETYTATAVNALGLTQSATAVGSRHEAESTLTLQSTADANGDKRRAEVSTIDLQQTVEYTLSKLVRQTINLTQTATAFKTLAEVVQVLDLTQTAIGRIDPNRVVSQLELTQEARSSIRHVFASNHIELTDSLVTSLPRRVSAISQLTITSEVFDPETLTITLVESGLSQSVDVIANVSHTASSVLSFAQHANGYNIPSTALEGIAESTLSLSQSAEVALGGDLASALALTQTATAQVSKKIPTTQIELTQEATANVVRSNVPASSTLTLKQAATFVKESSTVLCDYSPFVGASSDSNAPTPPSGTYTSAQSPVSYRLRWTDGMTTDDVSLPKPSLGNRDRITGQRFNDETRGGYLIVHAEKDAPRVETLLLTFTRLKQTEVDTLRQFMLDHLGQLVRYVDHEDRHWEGVIVQPGDPIVEDRRGSYTASFEFQGSLV